MPRLLRSLCPGGCPLYAAEAAPVAQLLAALCECATGAAAALAAVQPTQLARKLLAAASAALQAPGEGSLAVCGSVLAAAAAIVAFELDRSGGSSLADIASSSACARSALLSALGETETPDGQRPDGQRLVHTLLDASRRDCARCRHAALRLSAHAAAVAADEWQRCEGWDSLPQLPALAAAAAATLQAAGGALKRPLGSGGGTALAAAVGDLGRSMRPASGQQRYGGPLAPQPWRAALVAAGVVPALLALAEPAQAPAAVAGGVRVAAAAWAAAAAAAGGEPLSPAQAAALGLAAVAVLLRGCSLDCPDGLPVRLPGAQPRRRRTGAAGDPADAVALEAGAAVLACIAAGGSGAEAVSSGAAEALRAAGGDAFPAVLGERLARGAGFSSPVDAALLAAAAAASPAVAAALAAVRAPGGADVLSGCAVALAAAAAAAGLQLPPGCHSAASRGAVQKQWQVPAPVGHLPSRLHATSDGLSGIWSADAAFVVFFGLSLIPNLCRPAPPAVALDPPPWLEPLLEALAAPEGGLPPLPRCAALAALRSAFGRCGGRTALGESLRPLLADAEGFADVALLCSSGQVALPAHGFVLRVRAHSKLPKQSFVHSHGPLGCLDHPNRPAGALPGAAAGSCGGGGPARR